MDSNPYGHECEFTDDCKGVLKCVECILDYPSECICDESTSQYCSECLHKKCLWCNKSTIFPRIQSEEECEECKDWIRPDDECKSLFCKEYLANDSLCGIIQPNLECTLCLSREPIIRVPLAFPLPLKILSIDYPTFENIRAEFKKYYSYSHTQGVWEPYPHLEFELAQKYFNFDGGVIVLGRSKQEEKAAKDKDALKIIKLQKEAAKALKKERRVNKLMSHNG